jgi:hypothetical protein
MGSLALAGVRLRGSYQPGPSSGSYLTHPRGIGLPGIYREPLLRTESYAVQAESSQRAKWVAGNAPSKRYRFCANWEQQGCNWMVQADAGDDFVPSLPFPTPRITPAGAKSNNRSGDSSIVWLSVPSLISEMA